MVARRQNERITGSSGSVGIDVRFLLLAAERLAPILATQTTIANVAEDPASRKLFLAESDRRRASYPKKEKVASVDDINPMDDEGFRKARPSVTESG